MRLRATIQVRNDHMLKARERLGLTQADVAGIAGVSISLIGCLERLQFPSTYRYEEALLIADALHVPVESVLPEEMVGWQGKTKFAYTEEVPIKKLLDYENRTTTHYLLESPDVAIEKSDDLARLKLLIKTLSYREREIIKLRYGLDGEFSYTLEEVGRIFGVTREVIRQVEARAIRKLEMRAGSPSFMQKINRKSVDAI